MAALLEVLRRHASERPDAPALDGPAGSLSYHQLWQRLSDLARQLRSANLSRVGLVGDNSPGWVLADLACRQAGVVCVPIPPFFSSSQIAHLTARAGLEALLQPDDPWLGDDSQVRIVPVPTPERAEPMPAATAKITFTSGSTGTPKGVCLSQAQMDATVSALAERVGHLGIGRHLCLLPLATLLENVAGVYLPLLLGATVQLWPLAALGFNGANALDLKRLAQSLGERRPDSLILVPELAMALVQAVADGHLSPASFRFLAVGGARVAPSLLARARTLGLPLYEGYGLSECGSVVALNGPGQARDGTVGRPLGNVEVSVSPDGEIVVSGNTFLGYLGDPIPADARCHTGDLGQFDADGYLRIAGRAKNLLITSFGRNISPEWLESELLAALAARQAVVFGDGEPQPSALISVGGVTAPATLRTLAEELNRALPPYARLQRLYLLPAPLSEAQGYLTANGRPRRDRILAQLAPLRAQAHCLTLSDPDWQLTDAGVTVSDSLPCSQ